MKKEKNKIFIIATSFLSILILIIGTTFSYFTISAQSKLNAVAVEAGKIKLGLGVSSIYTGHNLIPTDDKDIMVAYKQKCLDDYNYGACLAYGFEIFNYYKSQSIIGHINFEVEGIENLSYMILDENDEVYLNKTSVSGDTSKMSLGPSFTLKGATLNKPVSKKFVLLVWLSNLENIEQNENDSGGKFSATVTYESVYGGKLTGTIVGYKSDSQDTSQIGDV